MKKTSTTNTYTTSSGEKLTREVIEHRIRKAKKKFIENYLDTHEYFCCERFKNVDGRLDVSHIVSVKYCLENGMSELAYSEDNFELLSNIAHQLIESWKNHKRYSWYIERKKGWTFDEFINQYKD